jgi:hypothetical protein
MVGPVSRVSLAMSTRRASVIRQINMAAGAAAMTARIRNRRAITQIKRMEFTSRMRSMGGSSLDTYA